MHQRNHKITDSLSFKNMIKRPARSTVLVLLAALLTFAAFGGTLIVQSLNRGLQSLRGRMGADIMVVPFEATTKSDIDVENIVLLGSTGYFYMDRSIADKIAQREGVGEFSTQYYLSTLSAGCCSVPVQIIGYDPSTDFTIRPWIRESNGKEPGEMEVVVGHQLNAFVGDTLTFYGEDVKVVAKLAESGTDLDTAVYTNAETIRRLMRASVALKLNTQKNADPDGVVSAVLLNVAEGYSVDEVLNDINIHTRGAKAFRTTGMMEGIQSSLRGITRIAVVLVCAVWAVCLIVLTLVFSLSVRERRAEFAVLRAVGASGKRVGQIVMTESLMVSLAGALIGAGLGALLIVPFSGWIEEALALPFLLPGTGGILLAAAGTVLAGVLCGTGAGAFSAKDASAVDVGATLRAL